MSAIDDIAAERRRQIEVEGFDSEHDDDYYSDGVLSRAAACYASPVRLYEIISYSPGDLRLSDPWPWDESWDKRPRGPDGDLLPNYDVDAAKRRAMLVKAGALIAAEIDLLDRQVAGSPECGEADNV